LYNDKTEKLEYFYDSDFKSYFISSISITANGIAKQEQITKYNALHDRYDKLIKVSTDNPSVISTINRQIHEDEKKNFDNQLKDNIWENHIKFFQSYIYDKGIKIGMPYYRGKTDLLFSIDDVAEKNVFELIKLINPSSADKDIYEEFARLLEYPAPNFKRISLDAEILNENEKQVPDPENANMPVLCVCLVSNTGEKFAFVLVQDNQKQFKAGTDFTKIFLFTDEAELLRAIFKLVSEYPFLITFNGDDFDLPYLANRALRLKIPLEEIPISIREKMTFWSGCVHLDLYKFFGIRAMQTYAFAAKYKTIDLDTISKALLGKGKIGGGKWVKEMTYEELIKYCMNDAQLTMELTTYNNNLVMNLILVLARLSKMPVDNVSRKSISNWIRSMIYAEHRKRDYLIPRTEEILALKGRAVTTALIKGKKYKGAVVVDPVFGIHFKTKVGDFASLYPTIIKNYNLGYATVECPHEDCKDNKFADIPHWICKKHRAIESQCIGSLRDLRVVWYKPKGKDKNLDKEKQNWYKVAEQSIKVFCNASYGVFGDEDFTLYCAPVAEYITGIGRWIITQTIAKAKEMGLEVIYGDTDSVFIKNPSKEKLDELIVWAKKTFDIEFELDKSYRYVCLSDRKKNYIGVLEDGFVDVKGMTGKKKHTPKMFKDAFETTKGLLAQVFTEQDMNIKRIEIKKIVKSTYNVLKRRSWTNMDDLAFHVSLTKNIDEYEKTTPQHVKAAKYLVEKGFPVGSGSTIDFVKIHGKKVKPASLTKKEEVDVEKYIEFLRSLFIQMLEPLGIDWDKDILGICQLGQWQ
jgi:DNA polymerase I